MENFEEKSEFSEREIEFVEEGKKFSPGEYMLHYLGVGWDDLRGKKVVDLGAESAHLAREAKEKQVEGIISIDKYPPYAAIEEKENYIAGEKENIPLRDESVDLVISSHVIAIHEDEKTRYDLIESARILREGGKLIIWPAVLGYPRMEEAEEKELAEKLERVLQEKVGDIFNVKLIRSPVAKGEYFYADYFWELIKKSKKSA